MLRSYPFKEADLVVSFLTRDQGKLRGVARRARRPKSPFGAGLERLSQVRMSYFQRENRELVNLDSCELVVSQFRLLSDYRAAVALDYFAEVTDQLLPPSEPNDRFFRLLIAVLEHMRAAELARMRGKFGALTPEQEQALEALTKSLINKVAHGPISELRRHASEPDGHHFIAAIRKVFRLGD